MARYKYRGLVSFLCATIAAVAVAVAGSAELLMLSLAKTLPPHKVHYLGNGRYRRAVVPRLALSLLHAKPKVVCRLKKN